MLKIAAIASGAAFMAAAIFAAPVNADAENDYISELNQTAILYRSTAAAIQTGYAICHDLRAGQSVDDVNLHLRNYLYQTVADILPMGTSGQYLSVASKHFCPDQRNRIRAWAGLPPSPGLPS